MNSYTDTFSWNNSTGLGFAGSVATASVVGGTASEIGGGKFENGAITGAFGAILNDGMHEDGWLKRSGKYIANNLRASGRQIRGQLEEIDVFNRNGPWKFSNTAMGKVMNLFNNGNKGISVNGVLVAGRGVTASGAKDFAGEANGYTVAPAEGVMVGVSAEYFTSVPSYSGDVNSYAVGVFWFSGSLTVDAYSGDLLGLSGGFGVSFKLGYAKSSYSDR